MRKLIIVFFVLVIGVNKSISQSSSLYVRGTGYNYSISRVVKLNNTNLPIAGGRGLCLTIINASNHQHVSSTRYDTYGSSAASDNLAIVLNNLQRGQIGVLTSYDAWEYNVTPALQVAARRLGLYKLGGGLSSGSRRPYAAIFRGSGTAVTANTEPNHIAYEVMQSGNAKAEPAIIATWLIDDAFIGNNLSNALVPADGNYVGATVMVNHVGNVGIGTANPDAKLAVNGNIHAKEVKVDLIGWPDYVFKKDYELPSLEKVAKNIQEKGHLINIPSEKEVSENGVKLGEMNKLLLEKIEELTLYTLEQQELLKKILNQNKKQQIEIEKLKNKVK